MEEKIIFLIGVLMLCTIGPFLVYKGYIIMGLLIILGGVFVVDEYISEKKDG